ncbi:ubiquitin carboxyl-terminal hydrolase 31-like [Centruroides sculpturatus]|uniref:ubiquitin carboxyl-terminal hydrolase 31-like n=1 Tax=Centruroides sculpturatus TaxID=218467 RepID=UPI000C6D19D3|nr:ubiquitin carboxyl-terminal hydrolase 31-like [Centruroides sculpturatus]
MSGTHEDSYTFYKLDVVSLYPSIPVFEASVYVQKQGVPMVSPLSAVLAELIMREVERRIFNSPLVISYPSLYLRYVNDILIIWENTEEEFIKFVQQLSSIYPTISFTWEKEQEESITFLDLCIQKLVEGPQFAVHHKSNVLPYIIAADAFRPLQYVNATIAALIRRALLLPSMQLATKIELDIVRVAVSLAGFMHDKYEHVLHRIILTEIESGEFQRTFSDTDCVSIIEDLQEVYAIATPKPKPANHTTGEHLLLLWLNKIKSTNETSQELISLPYILQISREATYKDIRINIVEKTKEIFKENLTEEEEKSIRLYVVGGIPEQCYLPDDVDHPLYVPTVDHALALCEEGQNSGPTHLKLIVEWESEIQPKLIDVPSDLVKEESSWNLDRDQQQKVSKTTLYECFEMYFKEEKLEAEDAWMCPSCKCRQQVVKQLSLWTVPDIFVVHLKRFRQSSTHRTKLTTLVEFPLMSLDISQFMTSRRQEMPAHIMNGNLNTLSYWSPWKRHRLQNYSQGDDVYELYAVCNHQGNMLSGHYTGYCKNPVDGHWYLFDDTKVTQIPESKIVTANAYILFYQKSNLSSSSCASSSTSGYSTASTASLLNTDHWSFRMPPFHCLISKINKSQDTLCDIDVPAEKTLMQPNRPFDRRHRAYSSMVSLRSQKTDIQPSVFHELERHSDEETIEPIIESNSPVLLQDLNRATSKSYWTVTSV